jgi:hypothetical protein
MIALINLARGTYANVALVMIECYPSDGTESSSASVPSRGYPPRSLWDAIAPMPRPLADPSVVYGDPASPNGFRSPIIGNSNGPLAKSFPFRIAHPLPPGMLGSDSSNVGRHSGNCNSVTASPFYKNEASGSVDRLVSMPSDLRDSERSPDEHKGMHIPRLSNAEIGNGDEKRSIAVRVTLRLEDSIPIRNFSLASPMLPMSVLFDARLSLYVSHEPIHEYVVVSNPLFARDPASQNQSHSQADWIGKYVEFIRANFDSCAGKFPGGALDVGAPLTSQHALIITESFASDTTLGCASEFGRIYSKYNLYDYSNEHAIFESGSPSAANTCADIEFNYRMWALICDGWIDSGLSQTKFSTQLPAEQVVAMSKEVLFQLFCIHSYYISYIYLIFNGQRLQNKFREFVLQARGLQLIDALV